MKNLHCVVIVLALCYQPTITGGISPIDAVVPKTHTNNRETCPISPTSHLKKSNVMVNHGGSISSKSPSIYWAVLHNWLYSFSLGFNAINVQFLIRDIIDGDGASNPSAKAIALSGKVESVDKFLTFIGIGFLCALSDKFGRKPLMVWSALGFMVTNLIQATTKTSIVSLYLADFVDGCSSCIMPLCQAYVVDVSPPDRRATNLGIFQGLSIGGAFIFAFPIGGILGAKYGPRFTLLIAAAIQMVNAIIIMIFTPESNAPKPGSKIDLREANPINGLVRLFGENSFLRATSLTLLFATLARTSLDAQFTNYSNIRFGWTQAQSGPVLVMVGLMLAIGPRIFVPLLGLKNAILSGLLLFAAGLTGAGLAPTPVRFIGSIAVLAVGCMCLPALQALLVSMAKPGERGALLGSVGSLNELMGAIGSTLYASVLAKFTGDHAPLPIPGMHLIVGASFLLIGWGISLQAFVKNHNHPALTLKSENSPK